MSFTLEATERLNKQAPELGKAILAFKDLTDELPANSGIQVGLFIIKTGVSYFYVPVLSKAGTIQPIDSIFCATTKRFIPLTKKSIEWLLEAHATLGTSAKIPDTAILNPSLYDAIVPPKTGKLAYASTGRIGEFLSMLPNHIKQAMVDTLGKDIEIRNSINKVMDFNEVFLGPLQRATPEYIPPAEKVVPVEVLTGGTDLTDTEIQEVLDRGYSVRNAPLVGSVAVESSGENTWSTIQSAAPGTAYTAMYTNGSTATLVSLPRTPSIDVTEATTPVIGIDPSDINPLVISTDGTICRDANVVVMAQEQDFIKAVQELKVQPIGSISQGKTCIIYTGEAFLGPLEVLIVEKVNGWINIQADLFNTPICIKVHDSVHTKYAQVGKQILLNTTASFIETNNTNTFETDINAAEYKYNMTSSKMLPVQVNVIHRDGVYAVDGLEVGDRPAILGHMLKSWGLDVATAESFIESALKKSSVLVKMAATGPTPIVDIGEKPAPTVSMSGDARQRSIGMSANINQAAEVNDREIMEATIISQLLQNPDMHGYINEYLPDIKDAVDKLGRTLFLMRLNTEKLSKTIESEALNNLLTSTRNSYRILGETYVELSNLVANE